MSKLAIVAAHGLNVLFDIYAWLRQFFPISRSQPTFTRPMNPTKKRIGHLALIFGKIPGESLRQPLNKAQLISNSYRIPFSVKRMELNADRFLCKCLGVSKLRREHKVCAQGKRIREIGSSQLPQPFDIQLQRSKFSTQGRSFPLLSLDWYQYIATTRQSFIELPCFPKGFRRSPPPRIPLAMVLPDWNSKGHKNAKRRDHRRPLISGVAETFHNKPPANIRISHA